MLIDEKAPGKLMESRFVWIFANWNPPPDSHHKSKGLQVGRWSICKMQTAELQKQHFSWFSLALPNHIHRSRGRHRKGGGALHGIYDRLLSGLLSGILTTREVFCSPSQADMGYSSYFVSADIAGLRTTTKTATIPTHNSYNTTQSYRIYFQKASK